VQDYVQQDRLDSYTLPRALKRIIERKAAEETLFFEQQRAEVTPHLNRRRRAQHRCPAFLPAQQCAGGQGSYFNRPLVAEQFARLLDTACRTCSSSYRLRRSARRRRPVTGRHVSLEVTFMNVRPLHDRIIVHRLEEGDQQIGGIIIPDTAKEKPQQGTVIAVGNGKVNDDGKRIPLDVKAGDRILFGKYAGQEITLDGEEYLTMKEDDVLAVIEGQTKKKLAAIKGTTKKKQAK
jgi:chaperonin GroES